MANGVQSTKSVTKAKVLIDVVRLSACRRRQFSLVPRHRQGVARHAPMPALSLPLKHFIQHSTLLYGCIYTRRIFICSRRPYYPSRYRSPSKKSRPAAHSRYPTRHLLLHELDDYEDEVESIHALALVREMSARCKSLINADGGHTKYLIESGKTREMRRRKVCQATPCRWRRTNEDYPLR